jgi:hypothetical protein
MGGTQLFSEAPGRPFICLVDCFLDHVAVDVFDVSPLSAALLPSVGATSGALIRRRWAGGGQRGPWARPAVTAGTKEPPLCSRGPAAVSVRRSQLRIGRWDVKRAADEEHFRHTRGYGGGANWLSVLLSIKGRAYSSGYA